MKRILLISLFPVLLFSQIDKRILFIQKHQNATILNGTTQFWTKSSPVGLSFERTDSFSVVTILNIPNFAAGTTIISRQLASGQFNGWALGVDVTTGAPNVILRNTVTTNEIRLRFSAFSLNKYFLYVVTYNGSSDASGVKAYVDGVELTPTVINNTLSATIVPENVNFQISGRNGAANAVYVGRIGPTQVISGKVLSQAEIALINNSWRNIGFPKSYADGTIVAWYDWKSGGFDKSGNGNHLTPVADPPIVKIPK